MVAKRTGAHILFDPAGHFLPLQEQAVLKEVLEVLKEVLKVMVC